MSADLGYLDPLFKIAESLTHDDDPNNVMFGLGSIADDSSLAADNKQLQGYKVSTVVTSSITAALDHIITLQLMLRSGVVTSSAPWTLLRGAAEPLSLAIWVLNGESRKLRQTRALRVWRQNMKDRGSWERNIGYKVEPPAESGDDRATEIIKLAKSLGISDTEFKKQIHFSRLIEHAGDLINGSGKIALAHWCASSGFAHGRYWPTLRLSNPRPYRLLPDGVEFSMALDENKHREFANDVLMFLERALVDYADAADGKQYTP